jgi:hypothetical protein
MPWTALVSRNGSRQTTEDKDGAYCLLGILNIFMPHIYGEGKDNTLRRLQKELDGIPYIYMVFLYNLIQG